MRVAALIPCRSGSKRIPDKNFRTFCGKPLYQWTYETAVDSGIFDAIFISRNKDRPPELCTDEATMEQLLGWYMQENPEYDLWCILQPTSPLRTADDIKAAYDMLINDERDSIVSVFSDPLLFWVKDCVEVQGQMCPVASFHIDRRPNSQDRQGWYKENGAIYFVPRYTLMASNSRCGGRVGLYVMPKERSYEIDDMTDWEICEMLMSKRAA